MAAGLLAFSSRQFALTLPINHRPLSGAHNIRPRSEAPCSLILRACSWFGPCLDRIGGIPCTSATQFHLLHRRSVSNIRGARLGNFHGKSRGGKRSYDSPCARVYRQGRYSRVVDLRIHVTDAAIGLRRASKNKDIDEKTLRL